jgi:hypothetical protein
LEAFDRSEKGFLELQRPDATMMKTHNWTRPISSQSFIGQLRYGDLLTDPAAFPKHEDTKIVIDVDDRTWVTLEERTWPHTAQTLWCLAGHHHTDPSPACFSGTMIGAFTAISVAHGWFDIGIGWANIDQWSLGTIRRWSTGTATFNHYAYSPVNYCYSVIIPNGWVSSGGWDAEDLAVVDFHGSFWPGSCDYSPGFATGGIVAPAYSNASYDYSGSQSKVQAYDFTDNNPPMHRPVPQQYPLHPYFYEKPSLVKRHYGSFHAWIAAGIPWRIESDIDDAPGASGAGLMKQLFIAVGDPTWYWTAQGTSEASLNFYRRLDATVFGFIQTWSTEY